MILRRLVCATVAIALLELSSGAACKGSKSSYFFKVSGSTFSGKQKLICVIEGRWSDSDRFRYDAWDKCSAISIRRMPPSEYRGLPSLGQRNDISTKDIPVGSEVLMISNPDSQVLVFRDKKGRMREILTGD